MCYKLVDRYESATLARGSAPVCAQGFYREECDSLVYGCLIRGLQTLKLFPKRANVSEVESSVMTLADELRSLKCFTYFSERHSYHSQYSSGFSHSHCGFKAAFAEQIEVITDQEEPSGVLEEHLRHIDEQKKK